MAVGGGGKDFSIERKPLSRPAGVEMSEGTRHGVWLPVWMPLIDFSPSLLAPVLLEIEVINDPRTNGNAEEAKEQSNRKLDTRSMG